MGGVKALNAWKNESSGFGVQSSEKRAPSYEPAAGSTSGSEDGLSFPRASDGDFVWPASTPSRLSRLGGVEGHNIMIFHYREASPFGWGFL